jgi:ribokinase
MTGEPEIVVVGSHAPGLFVRVKRPPLPGETVIGWDYHEPVDGGKGSNQAIAAARLGARTRFIGCVGSDRLGEEGERWMREAGVDTSRLRKTASSATGNGFILLADDGVPAMVTCLGANGELGESQVEEDLGAFSGARVLLTQLEINPPVALHAIKVARRLGMLTILNPAPALPSWSAGLDQVDFLTPNESEAKQLLGIAVEREVDPERLAEQLLASSGAGVVLVTAGEWGVAGCERGGSWSIRPPQVPVVDTSGAGDVFCAALAIGLARGETAFAAADWACTAAALSVTKSGTIPAFPSLEEVQAFLSAEGKESGGLP